MGWNLRAGNWPPRSRTGVSRWTLFAVQTLYGHLKSWSACRTYLNA